MSDKIISEDTTMSDNMISEDTTISDNMISEDTTMSGVNDNMISEENKKKRKLDGNNEPQISGDYDINPTGVTDNVVDGFQVVGDAVQPFLPLFSSVSTIIDSIIRTYKNAKCNQKICLALIDRVEIAQQAVNSLQRQQRDNEELFRKQNYYDAWVRFKTVLENIKKFVKEITQLSNLQKFLTANAVKDAFDKNIKEFEEVCNDLNFTLAIYDRNKRDIENKKIMEDIDLLNKVLLYYITILYIAYLINI
ncbi:3457_t:CDS:1 [Scutellospora calospora]|uniref:3457_t:CDS:1 n=1 Tax=Scutellospora calospora TaxID=85575 RepID=A0ACA9LA34_9GLOM|nr:3457_t:CDS:1 [Scutellospora calospora]